MSVTLSFKVKGDHLVRLDNEKITDKTRNYILLSFTSFTEEWDNLNIYLILQDEDKMNYLFDLNEEEPIVTVPEPSGYTTSHIRPVEPGDYSKDIFEQFITTIDGKVEVDINDLLISLTEGIRE